MCLQDSNCVQVGHRVMLVDKVVLLANLRTSFLSTTRTEARRRFQTLVSQVQLRGTAAAPAGGGGGTVLVMVVGTTRLDALVRAVDDLAGGGSAACVGSSTSAPRRTRVSTARSGCCRQTHPGVRAWRQAACACSWSEFTPSLAERMAAADLVISHAGSGSGFKSIAAGKALTAILIAALMPNRQAELAGALSQEQRRRDVLLAASGVLLAAGNTQLATPAIAAADDNKRTLEVRYLTAFQKSAQKIYFQKRAETELRKVLSKEDAPAALRLVLHDAATYNVATGKGGPNGSIALRDELNRPENASLKDVVGKLKKAKAAIDAGGPAISWADTAVLGAKVAVEKTFIAAKIARAGNLTDGETISKAFGADWPVFIGRVDATEPDVASKLPSSSASPAEVQAFMSQLGTDPKGQGGPFSPKPLFWERPTFVLWTAAQEDPEAAEQAFAAASPTYADLKQKYDRSRKTVTRTDYEVDFITFFTRLTGTKMGAKFDDNAYLQSMQIDAPKL
ncbi:hypothetical protein WJX81_001801 [Elliptochloris bilobata]|uniref:N-acetylglucosaminyldiphosphodolichol N-acetylglucosaminyltransferase n=1 Tax=Elliptochloris bilobata TaxID=381761 RepID=A0AAW1SKD8_9CHLO